MAIKNDLEDLVKHHGHERKEIIKTLLCIKPFF